MTPASNAAATDLPPEHPLRSGASKSIGWECWRPWVLAMASVSCFHVSLAWDPAWPLVLVYLGGLAALAREATYRRALYPAWLAGVLVIAPQTAFLWNVFGAFALVLWAVVGAWHGLFAAVLRTVWVRLGWTPFLCAAPIFWMAQEFVRSECNPLRFAWLTAGSVIPIPVGSGILHWLGLYGTGAVLMALAVFAAAAWRTSQGRSLHRGYAAAAIGAVGLILAADSFPARPTHQAAPLNAAGVQWEFPGTPEVLTSLNSLIRKHPGTELVLLSEYTFDGPVPESVRAWCRRNGRWLVAGGKAPLDKSYRNTAFVISPGGEVVFEQAKSVPIQFFQDGLPAQKQELWNSPWGPIGIGICYDASYTRVMDHLVRLGAAGLLVPTMDVEDWGAHEHFLNARMSRIRAVEYGLPVFRVASSGISMMIRPRGDVAASAPYPGPGESLFSPMALAMDSSGLGPRHLPWDRIPCRLSIGIAGVWMLYFAINFKKSPHHWCSPINPAPVSTLS